MDTLRVRLGVTRGPTFLISGTIPQAYLLLMSLMLKHSSDHYVLFVSMCVIMHEGVDESLHNICKYQHNVPLHCYLFDTLVYEYNET